MVKNPPANARDSRDMGSTPGSGRSPGVESGNSLQYTGLEISMDRGIYSPWGYKELDLTDHTHTHTHTHGKTEQFEAVYKGKFSGIYSLGWQD